MKFVFRLDPVLRQRSAIERQRQIAVAVLERERSDLEQRIRACHAQIEQERQELRTQLSGGGGGGAGMIDFRGVRYQAGSSLRLHAAAQRAVLQLAGVHARLDEARKLLREASAAKKAVELLRERRWQEHKLAEQKAEQAWQDELMIMRAGRAGDTLSGGGVEQVEEAAT